MRMNGGYSLHQSLTTETAAIVKQAIGLARRRGHAQVTPLHVAIAMLSYSGSFKRACLQSRSHPLQSKALDLCFNVALNRLPTSSPSSPLLGALHSSHHHHHHHLPSLSNALVAAFKRAQAHQRRGSMENGQQQPVLALKIEVHQLVISILYDPSVSRVMREAGFSSAHVRNNVEQSEKKPDNVSINSTNTVPTITNLSQFRFPSLLCQQQKMNIDHHSEHANLALSLSLENRCIDEMHVEGVEDCKWLVFHEKAAEMKEEKEEKLMGLRSSAKLPPWLQQYKDESAMTRINVFNELSRKPDLVSNPNSSPNSASSSEDDNYTKYNNKFKGIDSEYTDMGKKDDQEEEEGNSDEMKKCGLLDLNMATEEEDDDGDENSVCKEIGILDLVDQQNRIRNPGLTINVN